MATNRILQLLRSNKTYTSFDAAKAAVERLTGHLDGEILLARYGTGIPTGEGQEATGTAPFYTAIGVYDAGHTKWTVFKSSDEIEASIAALQTELNNTKTGAGLGEDGSYTAPVSGEAGYEVLGGDNAPDSLYDAIMALADAIAAMDHTNNYTAATTGNDPVAAHATDASKVISGVNQENGVLDTVTTDAVDLLLTGYQNTNASGAIAGTDTLENALSKLENATSAGVKVSEKAGNQIQRIENDSTAANNGLYSHVEIAQLTEQEVTALSDSNVREAYKLINPTDRTAIGDVIKIYKDSALTSVYLGTMGDTLSGQDAQGQSASSTVVNGEGSESLNFIYHLENGNYKMEKVNVETFLQESEFGNGLQIVDHIVSVKASDGITVDANGVGVKVGNGLEIDSTSKAVNVKIDNTNDTNRYLSVSANGVALNGNAIDEKIANAKTTITEVAAVTETTADGNQFIKVVKTAGSGSTPDNYAISTQGINDAIAVETARAESAEQAIDAAVGLTKAANAETRTYTSQVTLGSGETAPKTVAGDIDLLDAHVQALDGAAVKSVTGSNAININTTSPADAQNPIVELKLDATTQGDGSEKTGTDNALTITNAGLFLSNTWDCGVY